MKIIIPLILLMHSMSLFAQREIYVEWTNSQGQVDYIVESVWGSLDRFMVPCLLNPQECRLNSEELQILKYTFALHKDEKGKTLVEVLPMKADPKLFLGKGNSPRVAVTGDRPFAPIYFNMDMMIDKNDVVMSRSQVISFFVHELSHHQGIGDTGERLLDKIGNAVSANYDRRSESIDLGRIRLPNIGAYIHNIGDFQSLKRIKDLKYRLPQIGINYGMATYDLHDRLESYAGMKFKPCSNGNLQLMHASNLRWFNLPSRFTEGARISILSDLKMLCGKTLSGAKEFEGNFIFSGELTHRKGSVVIKWETQAAGITQDKSPKEIEIQEKSFRLSTSRIVGGGDWKGEVSFKLNSEIALKEACNLGLGADQFLKYITGEMYRYTMHDCKVESLGAGEYIARFKQNFRPTTRSGKYWITELNVFTADGKKIIPIVPLRRPTLDLRNSGEKIPSVGQVRLYDKTTTDVTDRGLKGFRPGDNFSVISWIRNYSPIINFHISTVSVDSIGVSTVGYELYKNGSKISEDLAIKTNAQNGMMAVAITHRPKAVRSYKRINVRYLELLDENFNLIQIPLGPKFTMEVAP